LQKIKQKYSNTRQKKAAIHPSAILMLRLRPSTDA